MKKIIKIVLVVFAVILCIGLFAGGDDETPTTSTPEEKIEYITYSINDLCTDLDENALNAQKKYKGQYVEITGKLSNIDSDGNYFSLDRTDKVFTFLDVQCYIRNDEQLDTLASYKIGDKITVRGKISDVGEIMGYSLDLMEFVK